MKNGFFLATEQQIQRGASISGVGFLLYLAAAALRWAAAAGILAVVFAIGAAYVFVSIVIRSSKGTKATYSLLWGQGALTILLVACAALSIKVWLHL